MKSEKYKVLVSFGAADGQSFMPKELIEANPEDAITKSWLKHDLIALAPKNVVTPIRKVVEVKAPEKPKQSGPKVEKPKAQKANK